MRHCYRLQPLLRSIGHGLVVAIPVCLIPLRANPGTSVGGHITHSGRGRLITTAINPLSGSRRTPSLSRRGRLEISCPDS